MGWYPFPHPARDTESVIGGILGLFLFAAGMFNFVTMVRTPLSLSKPHELL